MAELNGICAAGRVAEAYSVHSESIDPDFAFDFGVFWECAEASPPSNYGERRDEDKNRQMP